MADYSLRQRGYLRQLFRNQLATLKALSDGDIDHAYLWANAGWTVHASPELNARARPGFRAGRPLEHRRRHASGDDELKAQVDRGTRCLIADGTVARALARYHVPYFAPFPGAEAADAQGSARESIRHAVADRGPEPQMQKIQTSKHPLSWSGASSLGRGAGRGAGPEQPAFLDGPSTASRARSRNRRPARRAARGRAADLLGLFLAMIPIPRSSRRRSSVT